ncbi:hypothetical protein Mapa_004581 [Marchantia paleacea]|nr:hypothetical protein Mapa_004581 [Marchantia paleacea]
MAEEPHFVLHMEEFYAIVLTEVRLMEENGASLWNEPVLNRNRFSCFCASYLIES